MSKTVSHTQHLSVATRYTRHENGHVETMFGFVPSVGDHFFNYKGTWIKAERLRFDLRHLLNEFNLILQGKGYQLRRKRKYKVGNSNFDSTW
jgi:hypothetical protein